MKVEKGKFAVIDFELYMLKCEYRHGKLCMTYSREDKVGCARENCPYVLWFFNEMNIEEQKEPYKTYVV